MTLEHVALLIVVGGALVALFMGLTIRTGRGEDTAVPSGDWDDLNHKHYDHLRRAVQKFEYRREDVA